MAFQDDPNVIRWKVHLSSSPTKVYDFLATDQGRQNYWAKTAEKNGVLTFEFPNGYIWTGKILRKTSPSVFSVEYIGGSQVTFQLHPDGRGGTDLEMTDFGVPKEDRVEVIAGWGSVLMALKAAVDFGIDLRNHDPKRTWNQGYFDN